ncbi:MAG: TIGR04086 family membrane protein [Clostridia bacterium]|nr:TIGR04086 family membrane protein [Clostridia bacterium]
MEGLEKEKINYFFPLIKGLVIAFVMTIAMIFLVSVLLCNTNLNESIINPLIIFATSFSILTGGFFTTKSLEKNGIITGGVLGLIYILSIYILSSILSSNFTININSIILIISSILCGAIGGIIGVNMQNR